MASKSSNRIRLIGGSLRRRHITFADAADLRPTPDRVRETVFNWLGQDLTGKTCLDLFAGSGALGFEAASRHAKHVVMVEIAKAAYARLQQNRTLLGLPHVVELHHQPALSYLQQHNGLFDVIFLDPPFAGNALAEILPLVATHLTLDGVVYIEAAQWPTLEHGQWLRQDRAGEVHYGLARLHSSPR